MSQNSESVLVLAEKDIHVYFLADECRDIGFYQKNPESSWRPVTEEDINRAGAFDKGVWVDWCCISTHCLSFPSGSRTLSDRRRMERLYFSKLSVMTGRKWNGQRTGKDDTEDNGSILLHLESFQTKPVFCGDLGSHITKGHPDYWDTLYGTKMIGGGLWESRDGYDLSLYVGNLEIHGVWAWPVVREVQSIAKCVTPIYRSLAAPPFLQSLFSSGTLSPSDMLPGRKGMDEEGKTETFFEKESAADNPMEAVPLIRDGTAREAARRALQVKGGDTEGGRLVAKLILRLSWLENLPELLPDEKSELDEIYSSLPQIADVVEEDERRGKREEQRKAKEGRRMDLETDMDVFRSMARLDGVV